MVTQAPESDRLWADQIRPILELAWPLILASSSMTILMTIDGIMVGQYSGHELAALAAGRSVVGLTHAAVFGLLSGVMVYVAQAYGAGRLKLTGIVLRAGLGNAVLVSVPIAVLVLLTVEPIFSTIGLEATLADRGGRYASIVVVSLIPAAMMMVMSQFLEGLARVRAVMAISLAAAALNVLFNAVLIYGAGPIPAMGVVGAAFGSMLSAFVGSAAMFAYLRRFVDGTVHGFGQPFRILWWHGKRLWKFGWPLGFSTTAEMLAFSAMTLAAGTMGANELAAFEIYFTSFFIPATITIGIAGAVAIRVGHAVGAGRLDRVRHLPVVGSLAAALLLLPYSILGLLFPQWLPRAFTQDPEIVALAAGLLPPLYVCILIEGTWTSHMRAVAAVGDSRGSAIIQFANPWLIMMPLLYYFVSVRGLGLVGFGYAIVAAIFAGVVWSVARFRWITRPGSRFSKLPESSTAIDPTRLS